MKTIYLSSFGCKVNQFETAALRDEAARHGLQATADPAEADLIVINTCTVTAKAGAESRRQVRAALRANSAAAVVVTGCHAELAGEEIAALTAGERARVHIVGNDRKGEILAAVLGGAVPDDLPPGRDIRSIREISGLSVAGFSERTRALLRIQDGCDSFCSYCIVPHVRGPSRSLPVDRVLDQAAAYAGAGHHEIVVTGIHAGQYGLDLGAGETIVSLMDTLCRSFPAQRFRLSSIEPGEISDELLRVMGEQENFMPHLHIPLQSGDDEVLRRMRRRYSAAQFSTVVRRCRQRLPDAAIGIDVMAGFPGETEEQFRNTKRLLQSLPVSYLHVFPFSARPGTSAALFPAQVPPAIRRKRAQALRLIGEEKKKMFYSRFIGRRREALLESAIDDGASLAGYTDNYIAIMVKKPVPSAPGPVQVVLDRLLGGTVLARIAEDG